MVELAKPIKVHEIEGEGLIALLGQSILFYSLDGYIYGGILTGVNDTFIKFENPVIIMETGDFASKTYKDAQRLPGEFGYHMRNNITYFGSGK